MRAPSQRLPRGAAALLVAALVSLHTPPAAARSRVIKLGTVAPDYHQGFGTVRMSNVFPISDADAFELFVYDGIELEAYETWGWNFTVDTTAQTEVRNQWN